MKKRLIIRKMIEDGACLFRAVADQVYGDQDMHMIVRKHCMDYIVSLSEICSEIIFFLSRLALKRFLLFIELASNDFCC